MPIASARAVESLQLLDRASDTPRRGAGRAYRPAAGRARTPAILMRGPARAGGPERLTQPERVQALFQVHHRLLRDAVAAGGGEELQWLGDDAALGQVRAIGVPGWARRAEALLASVATEAT